MKLKTFKNFNVNCACGWTLKRQEELRQDTIKSLKWARSLDVDDVNVSVKDYERAKWILLAEQYLIWYHALKDEELE